MRGQNEMFPEPAPDVKAARTYVLGGAVDEQLARQGLIRGREGRDEAIARVEVHADAEWKDVAHRAALALARARAEFTTDDVWEALARTGASTHEPRALGAVMQRLARAGQITNTGRVVQSRIAKRHARPIAVWRSLIAPGGCG